MDIYSKKFEVTLSDVDENNELSNKGILRFLQEIACIHSGLCGSSPNTVEKTGIAWVVLNWKLHVYSRPCWNTSLTVKTWPSNQKYVSFYRDFEITDENDNLIAIATSKWIPFDVNKHTFTKLSPEISNNYTIINKHVFDEPFKEKFTEPESSAFVKEYVVLQRDLDTNHHVNNLNYLDFACEALPVNIPSNFTDVEIMYKNEAKLDDVLEMYYYKSDIPEDNEYTITIKNKFTDELHSIVKLKN